MTGCSAVGGSGRGQVAAGIDLPDLDARLRQPVPGPTLVKGEPARVALQRTGGELLMCKAQQAETVRFIDDVWAGFERPATPVR